MEAKHTPGPWVWTVDRLDQCESLRRSGSGDVVISAHADVSDYGLSINPFMDVSHADARLIAAAPELLEALEGLLGSAELARLYLHTAEEEELIGSALFDTIQQARSATAKATGA